MPRITPLLLGICAVFMISFLVAQSMNERTDSRNLEHCDTLQCVQDVQNHVGDTWIWLN